MSEKEFFSAWDLGWLESNPLAELNIAKLKKLQSGADFIDLSMINPDIPCPRVLLDRLNEASIKPENQRYAVSRGIRRLREAFAQKYEDKFNVNLDPEQEICAAMGTKDALQAILRCVTKPGDNVLLGAPTYPMHQSAVRLNGCNTCYVRTDRDEEQILAGIEEQLACVPNIKAILLNFPNNPTSQIVSKKFFNTLSDIASSNKIFVINDFVYGEMVYSGASAVSAIPNGENREWVLETYSLSKAYSIPGWRVGAIVGSGRILTKISLLKSHTDYGIYLPLQLATSFALSEESDFSRSIVETYQRRAKTLCSGLEEVGWIVDTPATGASVWAEIPSNLPFLNSMELAKALIDEEGVSTLPGVAFGEDFQNWVRFGLVVNEGRLSEMALRLKSLIERRQK